MTLIEIFDKTPIENIITTLALKPDRVIYVGADLRKIYRDIELYKKVLSGRGIKSELSVCGVAKNNLDGIVNNLYKIVSDQNEDYVVDFSGGDESSLVALGMILGDPKLAANKIYAFRINAISRVGVMFETVYDEFGNRTIKREKYDFSGRSEVHLTAEEIITIHGGRVFGRSMKFERDSDVCSDIDSIWSMSRHKPSEWNGEINTLSGRSTPIHENSSTFVIPKDAIGVGRDRVDANIWEESVLLGLIIINPEKSTDSRFAFKYKNKIVEECLNKSGSTLEYYTYKTALSCERDGLPLFSDVEVGIEIGWDDDKDGTRNEIDVMAMHGMIPIFISCKNGDVKSEELYKLDTVAEQFGGEYSEKALVTTAFFDPTSKVYPGENGAMKFRERTADMGVRLISMVHKKEKCDFEKDIGRLV